MGGSYILKQGPGETPHQESLLLGKEGGYQLQRELTSDRFVGCQGNLQSPTPCTAPLTNHLGGAVLMERLQLEPAGAGSQYIGLPPWLGSVVKLLLLRAGALSRCCC